MPISRVSANPPNLSVQQLSNPANNPLREPRAGIDPLPLPGPTPNFQTVQQPKESWGEWFNNLWSRPDKINMLPSTGPFQQGIMDRLAKLGYEGVSQPDRYGQLFQNLIANNQGISGLQNLTPFFTNAGTQALNNPYQGFQEGIANPAMRNFQQNTVPSLAERFTSLGEGAQRSSAFQGALGSAASNLESDLAGLRNQYGLGQKQFGLSALQAGGGYQLNRENALQNLLGMGANYNQNRQTQFGNLLNMGLQNPPFQYLTQQGGPGIAQDFAKLLAKLGTNAALASAGVPPVAGMGNVNQLGG